MNKLFAIILAVVLFISVVFQTMVIFDYHSDEINLGFFSNRETPPVYFESFDEAVAEQFFVPFDIYLKDGEKTWILRKDEDNFNILWNEGKVVLGKILESEISVSMFSWVELSENAAVLYKLGRNLPVEFIAFMMGRDDYKGNLESIEKFMIVPREGMMDIYVKSGPVVYEMTGITATGLYTRPNFAGLLELFGADPYYSVNSYTELHKFIDLKGLSDFIEPDIPVLLGSEPRSIPWLKLSLPRSLRYYREAVKNYTGGELTTEIEQTASIIKSNIITRTINTYGTHLDSFGNLFFSNQFNIYEVNKSGWISYKYMEGTAGDDKGLVGAAFMNAAETLSSIMMISESSSNLYLAGISEDDESYVFTFDYRYKGNVMVFPEDDHAAKIRSTATRTVDARVYPLNIEEMTGEQYIDSKYRTDFFTLTNSNGISVIDLDAYNMYLGYIKSDAMLEVVRPVWVIENKDGEKQILKLTEAGD